MAENKSLKYNKLDQFLNSVNNKSLPNLIIIYGQQYLLKQAQKSISSFLLGKNTNKFALDTLEGDSVTMGEIIEHVSTFSIFQSKKIILVKNIPIFQNQDKSGETGFSQSELDHFTDFIEKGFPENHYLILTTNNADKRKKIFKLIQKTALIIDCQVATGVRKADIDEQRTVLQTIAKNILSKSNKNIDSQAFVLLVELTGFNPELFSKNLEKLIAYSGKNQQITIADVNAVITRDKIDPVFDFTNAVIDKNAKQAIFYLNSILNKDFHILQVLKALENQIRKLLLIKCCILQLNQTKSVNIKRINFNIFKQIYLPRIVDYDKTIKKSIEEQNECFSNHDSVKKKEQDKLLLAPNPKNAFPVYMNFQKAENFSQKELNQALIFLSDIDYKMKSSAFDAKTALENFIINL